MTTEYHDEDNDYENKTFWTNESKSVLWTRRVVGAEKILPACTAAVILSLVITIGVLNTTTSQRLSSLEQTMSSWTLALHNLTMSLNETAGVLKEVKHLQFAVENHRDQLSSVSEALRGLTVLDSLRKTVATLKCSLEQLRGNKTSSRTGEACCDPGWELFSPLRGAEPTCYLFSKDSLSWDDARDRCSAHSAHLLILHTDEEWSFVTHLSQPVFHWIGLTDERTGKWEWVNQTPYTMDRRHWKPNQPDNWLGGGTHTEDCAHLHSDGLLNDLHCFQRLRYICQAHAHRL